MVLLMNLLILLVFVYFHQLTEHAQFFCLMSLLLLDMVGCPANIRIICNNVSAAVCDSVTFKAAELYLLSMSLTVRPSESVLY